MSNRKKLILIIAVIALILLIIIFLVWFFLVFRQKQTPLSVETPEVFVPDDLPEETETIPLIPAKKITPEAAARATLATFSASFAEKFGSYSNQSDYQNLKELKIFMTPKMWSWVEDNLMVSAESQNAAYRGQTSKALATDEIRLDESGGLAEFLVKCQRQETGDDLSAPRIYYQNINIKLKKSGADWLVDSAVWQ